MTIRSGLSYKPFPIRSILRQLLIQPACQLVLFVSTASNSFGQADQVALTDLTHRAYRWHNRQITEDRGFDPRKARSRDTFYVGIDLRAVNFMIRKYRQSGFFDEEFFANYRALALRMDKELRNKQAVWREGDLPPFNHDADPWCNCSDPPGVYWQQLKITSLAIDGNRAEIVWTSGKGFYYHLRAAKKAGIWKLSYLEGYDSKRYHWASAE